MAEVAAAEALAKVAREEGWTVEVTHATGTPLDSEGNEARTSTLVRHEDSETGGGSTRVYGDVKVVESVAVRCRRGGDYLYAVWVDGKFDGAYRPRALEAGKISAAAAKAQLRRGREDHRWLAVDATTERCLNHDRETRKKELA